MPSFSSLRALVGARPAQTESDEASAGTAPRDAGAASTSVRRATGLLGGLLSRPAPVRTVPEDAPRSRPLRALPPESSAAEAGLSPADRHREELVTRMQARVRGNQVRDKISVATIPDTGIVKVRIAGDADDLARVGFRDIDTTHGPKDLTYLAVPLDRYNPHLAGGERVHRPADAEGARLRQQLASDRSDPDAHPRPMAYINGSYYNATKSRMASPDHDEAAAVGRNKVVGAMDQPDPVPIPRAYADDYHRVTFPNGSTLTTAPQLSARTWRGKSVATFTERKADQPKYKFPADGMIRPGDLQHAEHPNPRSAINFPAGIRQTFPIKRSEVPHRRGDAVRMLVASDASGKVGAEAQGLTMVELSNVMARVGSFNQKPGPSYNLDGGASSVMGVLSAEGDKLMEVRGRPTESTFAANFVTLEQRADARVAPGPSRPRPTAAVARPRPLPPALASHPGDDASEMAFAPRSPSPTPTQDAHEDSLIKDFSWLSGSIR